MGFRGYWQAPIFHPAPFALAYSEHLFAQAVQIAPLYALTGNILLCYKRAVSIDLRAVGPGHVPPGA
jgi:hypothetical protein